MSFKVVEWVLDHSEATGAARMVATVLAENADQDTGECYPSLETICRRARVSVRTARNAIRSLEQLTEIETHRNKGLGTRADHLTNVYVFVGYLRSRGAKSAGRVAGWDGAPTGNPEQPTGNASGPDRQSEVDPTGNGLPPNRQEPSIPEPRAASRPGPSRKSDPRADAIARKWWERFNPRPVQPWPAVVAVISRALGAGWEPEPVARALEQCEPPLSGGKLDQALSRGGFRQRGRRGGTWDDVAAADVGGGA